MAILIVGLCPIYMVIKAFFCLSLLWMLSVVSLLVYFISVFAFSANLYPLLNRPLLFLLSGIISLVVLVIVADVFLKLVFHFNPTSAFRFFSFPLYILTLVSKPFLSLSSKVLFNMGLKNKEDCQLSINRICRDKEYSDYCKSRMQEKDDDVDKEVKMFQNALDFSNVLIKDCIVPRTEIIAIDVESSVDQLKSMFVQLNYSRIWSIKITSTTLLVMCILWIWFDHPHEIKDM
jgi:CBS domain containing-hemolysin-like protein